MRFVEHRTSVGGPTEAQTHVTGSGVRDPAHRLVVTPRSEVDTLCRLALLRYLESCDLGVGAAAAKVIASQNGQDAGNEGDDTVLWWRLKAILEDIALLDPACGEGHMLVGALEWLDTLLAHAERMLGINRNPQARRAAILRNNLYGVEAQRETVLRARRRLGSTLVEEDPVVAQAISAHILHGDSLLWSDELRVHAAFRQVIESGGFQLVLGNPPYVRHEKIADPLDRLTATEYKRRAFATTEAVLDAYIRNASGSRNPGSGLSHRSDLSVLFTVIGLSYLAPGGVLGYVLPSAVSSARYGEVLWRLLSTRQFDGQLVENLGRRTFANAAVNTALLVAHRRTDVEGMPRPDAAASHNEPPIATDSRAGRFDRPELTLDTLLDMTRHCCVPLQSLGHLKYPIKTGLNCFFYPDVSIRAHFRVEREFLIPVVKSPRDIRSLVVSGDGLRTVLFYCPHSREQLREFGATGALAYIEWGEVQTRMAGPDGERVALSWSRMPSLRGREPWYSLTLPPMADLLCPRFIHRRFFFALPTDGIPLDQTFYGLKFEANMQPRRTLVGALLNSSLGYLMLETHGRTGLGDGVRQFALHDMANLPVPDPALVDSAFVPSLVRSFDHLATRPILPIETEVQQIDRLELDNAFCQALGLPETVGAAARDHLTALVRRRLERARVL